MDFDITIYVKRQSIFCDSRHFFLVHLAFRLFRIGLGRVVSCWDPFSYFKRIEATRMGFEPTRAEPNGLAVHRLNHSATSSIHSSVSVCDIKKNAKSCHKTPLMGFEPTTSELEVQRASPLRHSGIRHGRRRMLE